ncbi:MAG: hypothetical protein KDK91_02770 [Gammaproteobacteria bacterium]|nr:hypothetical protein [Gammaproteobacteria bacterium]
MELVKRVDKYSIYKKRSNRYAVKDANHRYVHGEEKTRILAEAALIKLSQPNPDKASDTAAPAEEGEAGSESAAE